MFTITDGVEDPELVLELEVTKSRAVELVLISVAALVELVLNSWPYLSILEVDIPIIEIRHTTADDEEDLTLDDFLEVELEVPVRPYTNSAYISLTKNSKIYHSIQISNNNFH